MLHHDGGYGTTTRGLKNKISGSLLHWSLASATPELGRRVPILINYAHTVAAFGLPMPNMVLSRPRVVIASTYIQSSHPFVACVQPLLYVGLDASPVSSPLRVIGT
jgi:hypothetical protein